MHRSKTGVITCPTAENNWGMAYEERAIERESKIYASKTERRDNKRERES